MKYLCIHEGNPTQRAATVFKSKSKTTIKGKSNPPQAVTTSLNGC